MSELSGPMKTFNLQCFIDSANELVRADEVKRALSLLDNLPAWYREHPPKEISKLKNEIMSKIATPSFYATHRGSELKTDPNVHRVMKQTLRGDILLKEMRLLNKNFFIPNLIDLGPGEYWTPKMLIEEEVNFQYFPIWVNGPTYDHYINDFKSSLGKMPINTSEPTIYYACEIIEHLWQEDELRYEMNRQLNGLADVVHFSTPLHTFDTECLDWRTKGDLGHLRAYTSAEFFLIIQRLFPEYDIMMFQSQPMHIRGILRTTKFDIVKTPVEDIFK